MTVGLLLITHDNIGKSLLEVGKAMIGEKSIHADAVTVTSNCNIEKTTQQALRLSLIHI